MDRVLTGICCSADHIFRGGAAHLFLRPAQQKYRSDPLRRESGDMSEKVIPILQASDAEKLSEWYGRLGFEVESDHRFAPGLPLYRILRRGAARVHLSEHRGDAKWPALCYLYLPGLDAAAEEFQAPIRDQPWGREVKLVDPDRNRLRIGEPQAGGN